MRASLTMRQSVFAEARGQKYAPRIGMTMEQMNGEPSKEEDRDKDSLQWVRQEIHSRYADIKNRAWTGILRSTEVLSRLSSAAHQRERLKGAGHGRKPYRGVPISRL